LLFLLCFQKKFRPPSPAEEGKSGADKEQAEAAEDAESGKAFQTVVAFSIFWNIV
jgi:hypothetical protein